MKNGLSIEASRRGWEGAARFKGEQIIGAWGDWLGQIAWTNLVTLTFDDSIVFRATEKKAMREAFQWCNLIGWISRTHVGWLIAVERGHCGRWHAHVLLAGVPSDLSVVEAIWEARCGRIHIQSVTSERGAVLYTTKEAALTGELLVSDGINNFRKPLSGPARVGLWSRQEGSRGPYDRGMQCRRPDVGTAI